MELKEGAIIADRFRLVRQLGEGGMGEVWAAQHLSLQIPCAVKFIHAESAQKPEVRARFEREARAAAALRSPNVVQILDSGVFDGVPYIAMEYLDGEPLNVRLKRRGRLDARETFRIMAGVAKALTRAHTAGIIHRDLKPENIFLVRDEDGETPKVLDFGVAKQTDKLDSNTRTGALLGTPYFMSPEQAQGTKDIDYRADLWSLAVVVFRCITGELPFKSTALGDLLIKIVTSQIPVASHVAPGVPEGFDAWWFRAAQREPAYRFQSAKEMVDALGMALGVSLPTSLGQTPMPGTAAAERPRIPLAATVIADPSTGGDHAALPFSQSGASVPGGTVIGAPMPGAPMGVPPPPRAAMPSHGSGIYAPQYLGDSHASPTVGGVTGPSATGSSTKVAVLATVMASLVLGSFGALWMFQRSRAVETEHVAVPEPSAAPPPSAPEQPSEAELAEDADEAEPASSAAPADSAEQVASAAPAPRAKTDAPTVKARDAKPKEPAPKSPPTSLDVPKPDVPKPKSKTKPPKPASTFDTGF